MKLTFAGVAGEAWAVFRRDADLLLRIAGPFLFLPAYALTLLVPPMPMPDREMADAALRAEAWTEALSGWATAYGLGFAAAYIVTYFGWAVIVALYCDPARGDLRSAIGRAARLFPRFFLAMLIVSLPVGLGLWLLVIPGLYVVGRTLPTGPILLAEQPVGAGRAIGRALRLTRGQGAALMGLAGVAYAGGLFGGQPLLLLDQWLRGQEGGNPVAVALVDAGAAAAAALTQLALALFAIVAYRQLTRR